VKTRIMGYELCIMGAKDEVWDLYCEVWKF